MWKFSEVGKLATSMQKVHSIHCVSSVDMMEIKLLI